MTPHDDLSNAPDVPTSVGLSSLFDKPGCRRPRNRPTQTEERNGGPRASDTR